MRTIAIAAALTLSLGLALGAAYGGAGGHDHSGGYAKQKGSPGDTEATRAFRAADEKMHRDMDIRYTNDVDADFVRGMIPHHEGAIAMAKVALQHSKDPEIRSLAEGIVKAQESEIAQMRILLKRK